MTRNEIAIIDGGGANIASLKFALDRLGATGKLTTDWDEIAAARRVILPGVGAARDAMDRLTRHDLAWRIGELTQPVLGICLGLQLLAESSEEDTTACLGVLPGTARRFEPDPDRPVPHMGWNRIRIVRESPLLDGVADGSYFYFVHSYALETTGDTVATSEYGRPFTAIVQHGNFFATQFHPERSGEMGSIIMNNFINL